MIIVKCDIIWIVDIVKCTMICTCIEYILLYFYYFCSNFWSIVIFEICVVRGQICAVWLAINQNTISLLFVARVIRALCAVIAQIVIFEECYFRW